MMKNKNSCFVSLQPLLSRTIPSYVRYMEFGIKDHIQVLALINYKVYCLLDLCSVSSSIAWTNFKLLPMFKFVAVNKNQKHF